MKETFKDIPGFNGRYQISNLGRIRNNKGHIMATYINGEGYEELRLINSEGKRRKYRVHRLVLLTFDELKPNNYKELCVDHIDSNKLNNNLNNLQWLTNEANAHKALIVNSLNRPCIDVTTNKTYYTLTELAKELGCHSSNVQKACRNNRPCKGHIVQYI